MSISMSSDGSLRVDYSAAPTPIQDRILLSVFTRLGSLWHRPDFGRRHRPRAKLVTTVADDLAGDVRESLQWMVASEMLTSVDVETQIVRPGRIDVVVSASNGLQDFEVPFWIPIPSDPRAAA